MTNPLPSLNAAASKVVTRSVMNPLLWTLVITFIGVFGLAFITPTGFLPYLVSLIPCCLVAVFIAYGYFAKNHPALLLSEEHQHRQAVLQMLGDNYRNYGQAGVDMTLTDNPASGRLPTIDGAEVKE